MSKPRLSGSQFCLRGLIGAVTYCSVTFAIGRVVGMAVCVPMLYFGIAVGLALATGRLGGGIEGGKPAPKSDDGFNL